MKTIHIATIQIAIDAPDFGSACETVSQLLSELGPEYGIPDWQYLRLGGQQLDPTEKFVNDELEEGEAFA